MLDKFKSFPLNFRFGFAVTAFFTFLAVLSFIWTPFDVTAIDIENRFAAPGFPYILGTDHFGRDIFSMIMVGARNAIAVSIVAVGIGMLIGVPLGLWAAATRAQQGGIMDEVLMRGNDLIFAFPSLLMAIMITAVFGPGAINAIIAIGIFNIPVFARMARGGALGLWGKEYIMAARVAGKNAARISYEHILPNIANILIVQATIQFSIAIIAEASLSYVGLGTQPPNPSLGRMLNEAQTMIFFAPWLALVPGLVIIAMVMGLNIMGDGLRDILDPKMRERAKQERKDDDVAA
ncbi:ABC transporter permease [Pseudemcibacter aquimaris]|uniref:ABC transporter permease n=1 Tax=Pseudemcibacter aquimaris TaxID=2857064 RepID=UPI0020133DAE|nr:ABC transporter permease [Pseudemcibacter aquimaris]MCC3859712.1 ABC transporter permease [Pseudemcibacter aquimaris]WDU60107.1 ABC transporter permease [Pseudemcibacter aquimaris]